MDLKRHSHIYDELLKLTIDLNFQDVPTPAYIQEKIIQCNSFQIKVERFFIEVTRDLAIAERMFSTEKLNLSMLRNNTLTNNDKIKKMPTGKEREAAVDEILEDNHVALLKLQNDANDLTSILSAIKQKQSTLKGFNADVKSLAKLMEQQINRLNIGHPDDPDVKELSKTFSEIDKLEEEFNLDDVESSIEISQSNDSDEVTDSDDVVELDITGDSEELVAPEESVLSGESIVLGDKLDPEPVLTVTQSESGQSTEDIGEIASLIDTPDEESVPESVPEHTLEDDGVKEDNLEDELASFLTEDDSEFNQYEDDVREDSEENGTDTSGVGTANSDENDNSVQSPDIEIEDDMDSEVESKVTTPPMIDVDLSEIGIDLDLGAIDPPKPEKTLPPATGAKTTVTKSASKTVVKTEVKTEVKAEVKTEVKKKDVPKAQSTPASTVEAKKNDFMDIDLNDILSSLD